MQNIRTMLWNIKHIQLLKCFIFILHFMLYETFSDVLNLLDYFRGNLCSGLCCTCHFDVLLRFSCNVRAIITIIVINVKRSLQFSGADLTSPEQSSQKLYEDCNWLLDICFIRGKVQFQWKKRYLKEKNFFCNIFCVDGF